MQNQTKTSIQDCVVAAHVHMSRLEKHGCYADFLDDPDKISEAISEVGKTYVTDILNPSLNDFTPQTSRWMILRCHGSAVIAGGFRVEDLGDSPISVFWKRVFARHYGNGSEVIAEVSPVLEGRLSGRIAYFGDLYVSRDFRSAHLEVKQSYAALAHILTHMLWNSDWHYSFLRGRDAGRGAVHQYGFATATENPMTWIVDPPSPRSREEVCAYISYQEIKEKIKAEHLRYRLNAA